MQGLLMMQWMLLLLPLGFKWLKTRVTAKGCCQCRLRRFVGQELACSILTGGSQPQRGRVEGSQLHVDVSRALWQESPQLLHVSSPGGLVQRIVHSRCLLWSGWALTMTHLLRATSEGRSVNQNHKGAILMPVLSVTSIVQYFIITSICIKMDLLLQIFVGISYQILSKCVQRCWNIRTKKRFMRVGRLKVLLPHYSNLSHAALFPLGWSLLPPRNQTATSTILTKGFRCFPQSLAEIKLDC